MVIKGLSILCQAIEETFRTRLIVKSFFETGMYDPEARSPGVNVETMMDKRSTLFSSEDKFKLW